MVMMMIMMIRLRIAPGSDSDRAIDLLLRVESFAYVLAKMQVLLSDSPDLVVNVRQFLPPVPYLRYRFRRLCFLRRSYTLQILHLHFLTRRRVRIAKTTDRPLVGAGDCFLILFQLRRHSEEASVLCVSSRFRFPTDAEKRGAGSCIYTREPKRCGLGG